MVKAMGRYARNWMDEHPNASSEDVLQLRKEVTNVGSDVEPNSLAPFAIAFEQEPWPPLSEVKGCIRLVVRSILIMLG